MSNFENVPSSDLSPQTSSGPTPVPVQAPSAPQGGQDQRESQIPQWQGDSGFVSYAGFWKRFAASLIDGIILGSVNGILMFTVFGVGLSSKDMEATASTGGSLINVISPLIGWLYYSVMESSSSQGTLGKMALNIKVTDAAGNRISFGKATLRYVGKIVSSITLGIGYLMIAFTEKKQGLHDMIASTLVINK